MGPVSECILCGAPGGHPYCNAACEAATGLRLALEQKGISASA